MPANGILAPLPPPVPPASAVLEALGVPLPAHAGGGAPLGLSTYQTSQPFRAQVLERLELHMGLMRASRMSNGVMVRARLLTDAMLHGDEGFEALMQTFTYARCDEWEPYHFAATLNAMKKYVLRRGVLFRYVWTAELQQRGAVHYHLLNWVPAGFRLPKPDLQGWWPHGMTKIELARDAVRYIAKYASKGTMGARVSFEFPRGLRISGAGGLSPEDRAIATWTLLPKYLRAVSEPGERWKRVKGGVWINGTTGELVRSPWRYEGRSGNRVRLVRIHEEEVS